MNETRKYVSVGIYHVEETSLRTAFSVNILAEKDIDTDLGRTKTVVYIEEGGLRTGVTFPLNPKVVSLMDYDNTNGAREQPPQGYPLVCVTVCVSINIYVNTVAKIRMLLQF